jgi:hypothetical protein
MVKLAFSRACISNEPPMMLAKLLYKLAAYYTSHKKTFLPKPHVHSDAYKVSTILKVAITTYYCNKKSPQFEGFF